ncbi:hypothetical protein KEM54_003815 [Ascosphaera aggregata]|nr:hypothetical protein KEM54_003815 [Ascosphaera aggregata]
MAPEASTPSNGKTKFFEPGTPKTAKRLLNEPGAPSSPFSSPTKRKKQPGSPAKRPPRMLPTSLAQASEEDKMMFEMRSEDKPWAEIQQKWEEITGDRPLITSLRARYHKIKCNLQEWSEDDVSSSPEFLNPLRYYMLIWSQEARLIRLEVYVEEALKVEKWTRLADAMVREGSPKYTIVALQKKLKELKGAAAV